MSAKEYNTIEKALTAKLENKFNTEENLKKADDIALKQVWKIYEPLVNAVDSGYTLKVVFKN
ncbi:MAG: hypothetical protein DUD27_01165 [Lachnospiraceae bacterium]|uniref:Uncharacterized protein n=1 Tax=Candidatus Weimeria bifida TaxID=2599074 RepID=A0A6N7IZX7_9FIRM|nr:hypothetical protein [Candidatus Weimeria bifida]RRF97200.1 MAG: hypothetical protein DUD27_01165 [Lachnospiraceae bacterium]